MCGRIRKPDDQKLLISFFVVSYLLLTAILHSAIDSVVESQPIHP